MSAVIIFMLVMAASSFQESAALSQSGSSALRRQGDDCDCTRTNPLPTCGCTPAPDMRKPRIVQSLAHEMCDCHSAVDPPQRCGCSSTQASVTTGISSRASCNCQAPNPDASCMCASTNQQPDSGHPIMVPAVNSSPKPSNSPPATTVESVLPACNCQLPAPPSTCGCSAKKITPQPIIMMPVTASDKTDERLIEAKTFATQMNEKTRLMLEEARRSNSERLMQARAAMEGALAQARHNVTVVAEVKRIMAQAVTEARVARISLEQVNNDTNTRVQNMQEARDRFATTARHAAAQASSLREKKDALNATIESSKTQTEQIEFLRKTGTEIDESKRELQKEEVDSAQEMTKLAKEENKMQKVLQ